MVLAALAGAGCYTVLRHPEGSDLTEVDMGGAACADCHAESDLRHYVDEGWGDWYRLYPQPWAVFYQSPWWYDDYWYAPNNPLPPEVPAETGQRHLWDRRTGGGPGYLPYQGPQNQPAEGTPATGGTVTTPPPANSDGDKDKDKDKDKDDNKRRLWGR
jgi:hypothetical protein